MSWNAHRVFTNSIENGSYSSALKVSVDQENLLAAARDEIRQTLKAAFGSWQNFVTRDTLFEDVPTSWAIPALRPKFRMQGSFAYRTHVVPAHVPPQEIDLDDGLFLPLSFVNRNGTLQPMAASAGLFALVEEALEPLCKRRGWSLNREKSSCVRVELPHEHIDIALYAISDADFARLIEKAAVAKDSQHAAATKQQMLDSIDIDDVLYGSLAENEIALAHRIQGWKRSDPRKLDDWFHARLNTHGEVYRRVCRYLKGWRDFEWQESRLASIALMVAVDAVLSRSPKLAETRDDQALEIVARALPSVLRHPIANPVVEGARLDEGWDNSERAAYVEAAVELDKYVSSALNSSKSASDVILALKVCFGDRIPDDEDLVSEEVPALEFKSAALTAPAAFRPSVDKSAQLERAFSQASSEGYRSKPWAPKPD